MPSLTSVISDRAPDLTLKIKTYGALCKRAHGKDVLQLVQFGSKEFTWISLVDGNHWDGRKWTTVADATIPSGFVPFFGTITLSDPKCEHWEPLG